MNGQTRIDLDGEIPKVDNTAARYPYLRAARGSRTLGQMASQSAHRMRVRRDRTWH